MKVALIHDWLTGMRGGEYVLEALIDLYPDAEIFTLLHLKGKVSPKIESHPIHVSWLQSVPRAEKYYRHFLPLMPKMIEGFDLAGFDLVVSSSHCVAKGIRKPPGAYHVSYIHAPMRYVWDLYDDYFGPGRAGVAARMAARLVRPYLQRWDRNSARAENVDLLIANSGFVASQIKRIYGRTAAVIHPFADVERFRRAREPGDAYLMVGAFAPNKRVDLAIDAFNRLAKPLRIVGGGQEEARLRVVAGPTITFLGALPNAEIETEFSRARAFVFPGVEDFGITPVEAMAAGCPVIAYRGGGVLETVTEKTGIFFEPQTSQSLADAIVRFEETLARAGGNFQESEIRKRSQEFTANRFKHVWNDALPSVFRGHI